MLPTTIRGRLAWLSLIVTCVAVAGAGWAVVATYLREQQGLQQRLSETTRALSLVVDRELSRRQTLVAALAKSPMLRAGQFAAFDGYLRSVLGEDWASVASEDALLLNTALPSGAAMPERRLQRAANGIPFITRGTHVSSLFTGVVTGTRAISIYSAVQTPDGRPAPYNLHINLDARALQRVIEEQRVPDGWIAAVIDRSGVVVAREPDPQRWVGVPATADMRRHLSTSDEGFFESVALDGRRTRAFFSRSPLFGWAFVIAVPDAVLAGSLRRSLVEASVVALLLVATALIATLLVARSIVLPMWRLGGAAGGIDRDPPPRYEPTGLRDVDEVGQVLAGAAERIHAAQHTLKERVAIAVAEAERARARLARNERLEALGRLTGGVAHDVNNLLAVVSSNLFVLERRVPALQGSDQAAAIRRAVQSGAALTRKLLGFSRGQPTHPQALQLDDWLRSVEPMIRTSLGDAGAAPISLECSVAAGTRPARADPAELELALLNLAVNARDAMPAGGRLTIHARDAGAGELADGGGPMVVISVSDTGTGISRELLDRVFEPFFTTKPVGKGSGLGLSQVYGMCSRLGGTVAINSAHGEGTIVSMFLPAAAPGAAAAPPLPASGAAPVAPARLLYVEDNAELASATGAALEAVGYTVERAADADAALTRLDAAPLAFDAVLSDVTMPGAIDGVGLAERLRRTHPALPVVLLTGYAAQIERVQAAGFPVLRKPAPPEDIAAAIEEARRERRLPQRRDA